MAQTSGEKLGLPSFFQDNPWLDILAQRGAEPTPDFVASEASFAPAVSRAKPVIEPEPVASSPATPPEAGFPKELMVRLEASPELLEAIKELKEAIIMALSVSQRQATIVPIYIPISVTQTVPRVPPQVPSHAPAEPTGEVICPKCGRPGRLYEYRRGRRAYIYVLHGRSKCSLGPADKVKVKWPSLAKRALLHNAPQHRAEILSLLGAGPLPLVWSSAPQPNWPPLAERWWGRRDLNPGPPAPQAGILVHARPRPLLSGAFFSSIKPLCFGRR